MRPISEITNQNIFKIGRASDLCWIMFGKRISVQNAKGGIIEKGEFSLHLQCPWRMRSIEDGLIKLASADIYEPAPELQWSNSFMWDVQGNNLFDEKTALLFPIDIIVRVEEVAVSPNNDLHICFSNNLILESFSNTSSDLECWRFFKHSDAHHFVASGNGQEYQ